MIHNLSNCGAAHFSKKDCYCDTCWERQVEAPNTVAVLASMKLWANPTFNASPVFKRRSLPCGKYMTLLWQQISPPIFLHNSYFKRALWSFLYSGISGRGAWGGTGLPWNLIAHPKCQPIIPKVWLATCPSGRRNLSLNQLFEEWKMSSVITCTHVLPPLSDVLS